MIEVLIVLAGLAIGFGVANYLYDKKLAKLYQNQIELIEKASDNAFTRGWNAGEEHGRRQEALERILKRKTEEE